MNKPFITRLESLRGLAALSVALYHSVSIYQVEGLFIKALQLIGSGGGPVMLFFVLSGYVLGLSMQSNQITVTSYLAYLARRLFRILPLLLISIYATYLLKSALTVDHAGLSDYAKIVFGQPTRANELIENFILYASSINPVTWTIKIELFWSAMIPILILLTRSKAVIVLSLLVFSGFTLYFPQGYTNPSNYLHYGLAFYLGVCLIGMGRLRNPALWALGGLVAIWTIPLVADHNPKDMVYILSSAVIVWGTLHAKESMRFLDNQAIRYLGKISYSFYLWHFAALYFLASISPWQGFSGSMFLLSSIFVTLPVAALSYKYIEVPFMNIGRIISTHIRTAVNLARPIP